MKTRKHEIAWDREAESFTRLTSIDQGGTGEWELIDAETARAHWDALDADWGMAAYRRMAAEDLAQ